MKHFLSCIVLILGMLSIQFKAVSGIKPIEPVPAQPDSGYVSNTLVDAAIRELDFQVKEGKLGKLIKENGIAGRYIFDITIHKKGEVLTVFAYSSANTNIANQNVLKTLVKDVKFSFKIPENIRVKFNYTFQIN